MPRLKRKDKKRVRGYGESRAVRRALIGGSYFAFMDDLRFGPGPTLGHDVAVEAWAELRDELLPAFIVEHPGQRPWAWWECEAPEPRRRIDELPHPFKDDRREAQLAEDRRNPDYALHELEYSLYFGLPGLWVLESDGDGYEPEKDCLHRLGLLDYAESQALETLEGTEVEQ